MRDELVKFERYQKQFHFLIENDIETIREHQKMVELLKHEANNKKIMNNRNIYR